MKKVILIEYHGKQFHSNSFAYFSASLKLIIPDKKCIQKYIFKHLIFFKEGNKLTELLLSEILEDGRIYMIPALCRDVYFLRLAVVAERTISEDIRFSFEVIKTCADKVLRSSRDFQQDEPVVVDIDLSRKKAL